jgi:hypothetical protein
VEENSFVTQQFGLTDHWLSVAWAAKVALLSFDPQARSAIGLGKDGSLETQLLTAASKLAALRRPP